MADFGENFSQIDISEEEKDKLIAEVVRYILFKTYQNSGCPVRREELTQLITKTYRQRGLPSLIINEAKEKLSSIFGYEMKELQRARPSTNHSRASQQSSVESKTYIIMSKLDADVYRKYIEDKEKSSDIMGFTFAVVGIVYLAGGKISEENLWHHLRRLGLDESDENHPIFGNTKQALETLVQQRYLQKEKNSGSDGHTLIYELAERATEETLSERFKQQIVELMKNDSTTEEID